MTENMSASAKWLNDEDVRCFRGRLSRLKWLVNKSPTAEYWTFPGGIHAKNLFEEARDSFVYAQFLATTLLGLAYMEQTLAALFYEAGRNDLHRAGLSKLLRESHTHGLINSIEFQDLDRIRKIRNIHAHFRSPGHEDSIEYRATLEGEAPYSIIEQDAVAVMAIVLRMVTKNAV